MIYGIMERQNLRLIHKSSNAIDDKSIKMCWLHIH
jgi:hypothetical protein